MKISLVAWSEPAGKFDPNAPLEGNEDNMFVDSDLSANTPSVIQSDIIIPLREYGCLMAIADGMGGMNAGEVASAIAIDTIKEHFAHNKLNKEIASTPITKKTYLEHVIQEADKRIKSEAKRDIAKDGMGSTIIIAWLTQSGLTVSWCGDSRAYLFETGVGLKLLSEDHSYVQDLVRANKLDYNDTFDHPQGNIITRSLGDPNNLAQPDTREYGVKKGDIILLCSDGLNGVLRDRKTKDKDGNFYPGDNIEDIIASKQESLVECRKSLFEAAEKADWYDNVTVVLCKIAEGTTISEQPINQHNLRPISRKSILYTLVIFIILMVLSNITTGYYFYNKGIAHHETINACDSIKYEVNHKDSLDINIVEDTKEKRDIKTHSTNKTNSDPSKIKKKEVITLETPKPSEIKDTLTEVETELTLIK